MRQFTVTVNGVAYSVAVEEVNGAVAPVAVAPVDSGEMFTGINRTSWKHIGRTYSHGHLRSFHRTY